MRKAAWSLKDPVEGKPGLPSSSGPSKRRGVSRGNTRSLKKLSSQRRSAPDQAAGRATASPSRSSTGSISARHSYCLPVISLARLETAASCSAGLLPDASGVESHARS